MFVFFFQICRPVFRDLLFLGAIQQNTKVYIFVEPDSTPQNHTDLTFCSQKNRLGWPIWGVYLQLLAKNLFEDGFWSVKPTILQKIKNVSSSQIALRNFCDFAKKKLIPDFVFEFVRSNPGTKINKSHSEIHYHNRFHFFWIFCKSLSFLTQIDQIVMKIIAFNSYFQIN